VQHGLPLLESAGAQLVSICRSCGVEPPRSVAAGLFRRDRRRRAGAGHDPLPANISFTRHGLECRQHGSAGQLSPLDGELPHPADERDFSSDPVSTGQHVRVRGRLQSDARHGGPQAGQDGMFQGSRQPEEVADAAGRPECLKDDGRLWQEGAARRVRQGRHGGH
jgi:hypothetical protein